MRGVVRLIARFVCLLMIVIDLPPLSLILGAMYLFSEVFQSLGLRTIGFDEVDISSSSFLRVALGELIVVAGWLRDM